MSKAQEQTDAKILIFNPFDGDFGAPGDTVLSNKVVIARKERPCSHCGTDIKKGERVRSMSAKFEGQLMSYSWCALCCAAMATDEDPGAAYERRFQLRAARASNGGQT